MSTVIYNLRSGYAKLHDYWDKLNIIESFYLPNKFRSSKMCFGPVITRTLLDQMSISCQQTLGNTEIK